MCGRRRFRALVGGPAVVPVGLVAGCLHGLAPLTTEQAARLTEAQRIADLVTKGYGAGEMTDAQSGGVLLASSFRPSSAAASLSSTVMVPEPGPE